MSDTVEQFVKKWQTLIAIILAAGVGYGMKSAEFAQMRNEITGLKEEVKSIRTIEQRLERIETNQERNYDLLKEIRQENKK